MMAELQLGSDEDEREVKPRRDHRKYDGLESRRRVTLPASRPEEKVDPIPNKKDARSEAKSSAVDAIDGDSRRRRLSFPSSNDKSPSRKGSSSVSRSHNSEGDFPHDSDDSDQEREAPVINANRELFGAASASSKDGEFSGETRRAEIDALRSFVMRSPAQGSAAIRCYVERDRQGLNRLHPVFRLFLESGNQFLLCAQKRTSSKTSNYLLTMEQNPTNRRSNLIVGKLRSNWSGSEYTMYDDGMSPDKTALEANIRNILGAVEFSYDDMGPGRLAAQIPLVQSNGAASIWKDKQTDAGSADSGNLLMLHNKRPHFDEKTCGHVLDFGGRVTMPSIKNFQMMCDNLGDETVLQFGRVSCQPPGPRRQCKCHKSIFIMDVKYPLSPLQAFAICLATLDTKFTDLKLYDNVSKLIKRK
ncbi:Tubby-like protein [Phytophthora cinnamomi]|uniref:Tubby-like protein n=1 Tax=Phytophthora cinnamomi TaxID=4785 RepID=UPI00355A2AD5|nr:Tubby-like protein [Phytophthora cinnamomi]